LRFIPAALAVTAPRPLDVRRSSRCRARAGGAGPPQPRMKSVPSSLVRPPLSPLTSLRRRLATDFSGKPHSMSLPTCSSLQVDGRRQSRSWSFGGRGSHRPGSGECALRPASAARSATTFHTLRPGAARRFAYACPPASAEPTSPPHHASPLEAMRRANELTRGRTPPVERKKPERSVLSNRGNRPGGRLCQGGGKWLMESVYCRGLRTKVLPPRRFRPRASPNPRQPPARKKKNNPPPARRRKRRKKPWFQRVANPRDKDPIPDTSSSVRAAVRSTANHPRIGTVGTTLQQTERRPGPRIRKRADSASSRWPVAIPWSLAAIVWCQQL